MVQILEARERAPGSKQRWAEAFGKGVEAFTKHQVDKKEAEIKKIQENAEYEKMVEFAREMGYKGALPRSEKFASAVLPELMKNRREEKKLEQLGQYLGGERSNTQDGREPVENPTAQGSRELQGRGGFDVTQLRDEDIAKVAAIDPNVARTLTHEKDVALRENRAQKEFEERKRLNSPEVLREKQLAGEQAKADIKYNQELQSSRKLHEIKKSTIDKLEKLNRKGVTGKPFEKALERIGLINLTSEGRREFAADVKHLITDIRSILGGQFSQFEFQTILNSYPSADFSKEANEAILKNLKEFGDIRDKEFEIANQLKKENGGKVPFDFQATINQKLQEYANERLPQIKENTIKIMNEEYGIPKGNTLLFDPNGEPLSVPDDQVAMMLENGANLP